MSSNIFLGALVTLILLCFISVGLLGRFGPYGISKFASLQFWSLMGGVLIVGLVLAVLIGLMSGDSPDVKNAGFLALTSGSTVVLLFALIGIFVSYFLAVPQNPLARFIIGATVVPVACVFVGALVLRVAELFSKS